MKFNASISAGDFIDRFSILSIKSSKGLDVKSELLDYETQKSILEEKGFLVYFNLLSKINLELWELEDAKRKKVERHTDDYGNVSELITQLNDIRYTVKKKIDLYFESEITEQKSH